MSYKDLTEAKEDPIATDGLRLLRAFRMVNDPAERQKIIALVIGLADAADKPSSPPPAMNARRKGLPATPAIPPKR